MRSLDDRQYLLNFTLSPEGFASGEGRRHTTGELRRPSAFHYLPDSRRTIVLLPGLAVSKHASGRWRSRRPRGPAKQSSPCMNCARSLAYAAAVRLAGAELAPLSRGRGCLDQGAPARRPVGRRRYPDVKRPGAASAVRDWPAPQPAPAPNAPTAYPIPPKLLHQITASAARSVASFVQQTRRTAGADYSRAHTFPVPESRAGEHLRRQPIHP
jgi:hypothetical protein